MPDMPCPVLHRYDTHTHHDDRPKLMLTDSEFLTPVTPDLSIVPKKYHTFISPPLRRVFLDAREDNSRAVVSNLNAENAALKEHVTSLERDKDLLTDRCRSTDCELERRSVDEQTARFAYFEATADAYKDKENLDRLMAKYDALKFRARIQHGLALISILLFLWYFTKPELYLRIARSVGWSVGIVVTRNSP